MRLCDKFGPARVAATQAGGAALPAPDAANSEQPAVQAAQPQGDDPMMRLQMGLSFLLAQAQQDSDPTVYADVVMDNVPVADLARFVNSADPVAYLANLNPAVRQHEKWFAELVAEVKAQLAEEQTAVPGQGGEVPVKAQ